MKLSANFPCLPRETGKGRALEIDTRRVEANCLPKRKLNSQMNTCRRKYYIEKAKNEFGPFKDQNNTHKTRYYTETENNTLP